MYWCVKTKTKVYEEMHYILLFYHGTEIVSVFIFINHSTEGSGSTKYGWTPLALFSGAC